MNATYVQNSFAGGMNLVQDNAAIGPDQYMFGFNVRNRYGFISPVAKCVDDETAPAGKKQGIYAYGSLRVLFCAGLAYYYSAGAWVQIVGFAMSPTVETIWACPVPVSSQNFKRTLTTASPSSVMLLVNETVLRSPQALVIQDGINQPWLIFPDGTARVSHTYAQWTQLDKEYIPIGRQMIFFNGKLRMVSVDGALILQSVSGRPLDFMVNITQAGDKLPTEAQGGAVTTSHAVDYSEISCIVALNNEYFAVCTKYALYAVKDDFERAKVFGEPLQANSFLFDSGVVNQFSFIELLGDFAFVDFDGIKSFNAVMQVKFEGRNSVFTKEIQNVIGANNLAGSCAVQFSNYALFSIKTVYGYAVVVYDTLLGKWVSIDFTSAGRVKQFAVTTTETENTLFAITYNDRVCAMYSSLTEKEQPYLNSRRFVPIVDERPSSLSEHKSILVKLVFVNSVADGEVNIREYCDEQVMANMTKPLRATQQGVFYPVAPPVMVQSGKNVANVSFPLQGGTGWKLGYTITWDNGADLLLLEVKTAAVTLANSQQEQSYAYGS